MFNHDPYYTMINYYHLEWIILNNFFPEQKIKTTKSKQKIKKYAMQTIVF